MFFFTSFVLRYLWENWRWNYRILLCVSCFDWFMIKMLLVNILARVRVTINEFRINNCIYCTISHFVTALHRPLSHTDLCPQLRSFAAARSSASGLTSLHAADHLTPTSYCDLWPLASTASSWAGLTTSNQHPNVAISSGLGCKQQKLIYSQLAPYVSSARSAQKIPLPTFHTSFSDDTGLLLAYTAVA